MLILYFYIFQRGFAVLNATFQAPVYVTIVTNIVYYDMYHSSKIFDISLVIQLLIYSKKISFTRIKTIHVFNM